MSQDTMFPTDWRRAVVVVAHPDDVEYGLGAAVARWTSEGRHVEYLLASRGEAGIEGMDPAEAGPLREQEQRRSAAAVGVEQVRFLDFPDGALRHTRALRTALAEAVERAAADLVVLGYYGPAWAPDAPNQADHIEVGHATVAALAGLGTRLYRQDPAGTLLVDVEDHQAAAVAALAEHEVYLRVLDPETPVAEQARQQVASACPAEELLAGRRGVRLSEVPQ